MINSNMKQDTKEENKMQESNVKTDEHAGLNLSGHILIRDTETGEELVNKRNAIHYGNMARLLAQLLNNDTNGRIFYMAFGNGGTSVDTAGKVIYKMPRVSESFETSASLYSRTYQKIVENDTSSDPDKNKIEVIPGSSFTDLKITCTLEYAEPSDQDLFDSSTTNEGDYVFDELGLFSYPTDGSNIDTSRMLTHVIFHPVQKSQNREIEIIYTVRVQLS